MGGFFGGRCRASSVAFPAAQACPVILPQTEEVVHSYRSEEGQSSLSLENSQISPWASTSGIPISEPVQDLLNGLQNGAFELPPHCFAERAAQLGSRNDLNRAELYAAAAMLTAAIEQRPSEFADPARAALLNLLQNNSRLASDQLLIASQLYRTLDPVATANAPLRQAVVNILAGWTTDGAQDLNFAGINNAADFSTAAEALRAAFHHAPPSMKEHIRQTMARLFEATHLAANNSWRDIPNGAGRVQCAEVLLGYGNEVFLCGSSPGAARLRAALQQVNHAAPTPVQSGNGTGAPMLGGNNSGGPTFGGNGSIGPVPIALTPQERIDRYLTSPENARALLSSPTSRMLGDGGSPLQVSLPGLLIVDGVTNVQLNPAQMSRLLQLSCGSNVPMSPAELHGIVNNIQRLPELQQQREALGQALVNLTQHQSAALSNSVMHGQFQLLLTHLNAQLVAGTAGHDDLRRQIQQAQTNLNRIVPVP